MPLTIYDISKLANVSIATVSRVLNGNTNVRETTRKKVMDIIQQYDYTPNTFARAMTLHSRKTIGILCADSSDIFLAKAIDLLGQELQSAGYESILCCTGYSLEVKASYLKLILSKQVDGVILVGSNFVSDTPEDNQYIADASKSVPVMILNAAFPHENVYSVLCDDRSTTRRSTLKMLEHGVEDLIFLYDSDSYSCLRKRDGFLDACTSFGQENLSERLCFIESKDSGILSIEQSLSEYAQSHPPFHGVVASDDVLGIAALKYGIAQGYRIPEDFQVIGYNNSMLTECCSPELSSVNNMLEEQSKQLVKNLIQILSDQPADQVTLLQGEFIKRKTTRW